MSDLLIMYPESKQAARGKEMSTVMKADTTNDMPAQGSPWRKKVEMAQYYRCDIKTITNLMRRSILP